MLLLASLPQAQGTPPATPLTLHSREGRRAVPTTIVGGRELIALDDVASLFQVSVREDTLAGGLTITYKGGTIVASVDRPMASVSGRIVALPSPPFAPGADGSSRSISCRERWRRSTTSRSTSAAPPACWS